MIKDIYFMSKILMCRVQGWCNGILAHIARAERRLKEQNEYGGCLCLKSEMHGVAFMYSNTAGAVACLEGLSISFGQLQS